MVTKTRMKFFNSCYIPEGMEWNDPQLSPYWGTLPDSMCKTLLLVAEKDPLRDEAIAYAKKVEEAGFSVKLNVY